MVEDYQSQPEQEGMLVALARAGSALANEPLSNSGNWAKVMEEDYSDITSFPRSPDPSEDLEELKRIHRELSKN